MSQSLISADEFIDEDHCAKSPILRDYVAIAVIVISTAVIVISTEGRNLGA
jgi:hypothetical protein